MKQVLLLVLLLSGTAAARDIIVENVAALTDTRANAGDTVTTLGYLTAGDGGGQLLRWSNAGGTVDGGFIFDAPGAGNERFVAVDQSVANVRKFGAVGAGPHHVAIQAAIDAIEALVESSTIGGGCVYFPTGHYSLGAGLTVQSNGIELVGEGFLGTVITYTASTGTAIEFHRGSNILFGPALRNLSLTTNSTTSTKVGVSLQDTSNAIIEDCYITNWFGGDTVAIELRGREMTRICRVTSIGGIPIRIRTNVNGAGAAPDCDHLTIEDCYLTYGAGAAPSTLERSSVLVDSDVYLSNMSAIGANAWVSAKNGFYYNRTDTVKSVSHDITLDGIRFEQGTNSAGYDVYLVGNSSRPNQSVQLRRLRGAAGTKGIYVRQAHDVLLDGYNKSGSENAIDVDSCYEWEHRNILVANGAASITFASTMRQLTGTRPANNSYGYQTSARWQYEPFGLASTKPVKLFECDQWAWSGTITAAADFQQIPINSDIDKWQVAIVDVVAYNQTANTFEAATFALADVDTDAKKGVKKISGSANTSDDFTSSTIGVGCSGTNPLEAGVYVFNLTANDMVFVVRVTGKRGPTGL